MAEESKDIEMLETADPASTIDYGVAQVLLGHDHQDIRCLAYDSAAQILYSGGRDSCVFAWDLLASPVQDAPLSRIHAGSWIYSLTLYAGGAPDTASATTTTTTTTTTATPAAVLAGSADGTILLLQWDAAERPPCLAVTHRLSGHAAPVGSLAWMGERLVSGSWDETARVWDVPSILAQPPGYTAAAAAVLSGHENTVCAVGTGPAACVTGSAGFVHEGRLTGQQLRWWAEDGGSEGGGSRWSVVRSATGHDGSIRDVCCVTLADGGAAVVSCANDGAVRWWSQAAGACLRTVRIGDDYLYSVACLDPHGGGTVAVADDAGAVTVIASSGGSTGDDGEVVARVAAPGIAAGRTAWSVTPVDQQRFAVAYAGGAVCVFSSEPAQHLSAEELQQLLQAAGAAATAQPAAAGAAPAATAPTVTSISEMPACAGEAEGALALFAQGAAGPTAVYRWSGDEWFLLGPLTEPRRRVELEGQYYDSVIPVEVDSASKGSFEAMLGINRGDDAAALAQSFCQRHALDCAEYAPQIRFFIEAHGLL